MKRTLTLLFLFPLLMTAGPNCSTLKSSNSVAPSAQENDEPSYAGIITHIMSEATDNGKTTMFPCIKDVIVYTYDKHKETFGYVTRLTKKYYDDVDSSRPIRTSPDISSLDCHVSDVSFTKFPDVMYANIALASRYIYGTSRQSIRSAVSIAIPPGLNPMVVGSAAFSDDRSYLPGVTYKACKALDESMKALGKVGQVEDGTEGPVVSVNEIIEPSNVTDLLRMPGPHPLSIVVAFLKLQKQNNEYIPVPNENSRFGY